MRAGMMRVWLAGLCLACLLSAQNISSTVKGTVRDQSGAVVPGAECILTNSATGLQTKVYTNAAGEFVFLDVPAGTYQVRIEAPGFKVFQIDDVEVTSSEFHPLSDIVLEIGRSSQSITVAEKAPPVQTSSGELSNLVSGTELRDIAVKGRDFVSYLGTLPGVVDTNSQNRDAFERNALSGVHINGGRDTEALMLIDGMPSEDAGNNSPPQEPTMDSIAEVKVLTASYQAEYGRNGGGVVSVVTKSGTREFHGSAYEYYRHEDLNANDFFNNATGTPKQPYRYRTTGYSLGGPLLIPKERTLRDKLFFFFAHEMVGSRVTYTPQFVTTPTALERQGDFSQSKNVNGALIVIKDPLTGAPFPGNKIPQSEINPLGQSILNFFPLPNYTDPNPALLYQRNYESVYSGSWPRAQEVGRVDFNLSSNSQLYFRIINDTSLEDSPWGNWVNGNINYLLTPVAWNRPAHMYNVHFTHTFSPTLVDELMVGKSYNLVSISPVNPNAVQRSAMGNPPQLFPDSAEGANWIPAVSFGSTPVHAINSSLANTLPEKLPDDAWIFSNNISKVWGLHQIKLGIYGEWNRKIQPTSVPFRGAFNFGVDANNPYDSGDGFANALLGNFDTYQESTNWPIGKYVFWNVEWFVQDNWRVTKRLTLDYGIRFYHIPPQVDENHTTAAFIPGLYNPATAPVLYVPALNSARKRVALNPITGALAPVSYIGLFVPGAGNPADGSVVGGQNGIPPGLITQPWLAYGPRFGFAYDVFGNGKTAIRGGFGMFADRVQGNEIYNTSGNPPVTYTPTQYYGNLNTYTQSTGLIGPSSITEWFGNQKLPEIMNFNFGIQQQIGANVLDVSYVGMLSRHLLYTQNINPIPLYARFNPANRDKTTANSPLPDNFLRPYIGYSTVTAEQFSATANYNALEASFRRRLTNHLQLALSYTLSKALGTASSDGTGVSSYMPVRQWNYGPLSYDRRHTFVISYVYDLPQTGTRLGWRPAQWVLDNWELSGITMFQTGQPVTPTFTTQPSVDISGSSDGARIEVVGDPNIPSSQRTFYRNFNTAAFALPPVGSLGDAGTNILYGPGINNWDLSITKRFKLFSESRTLSFRGEFYNAFNHTQFSAWNTSAIFTPSGQQINAAFGEDSAARLPRNIELSARLVF